MVKFLLVSLLFSLSNSLFAGELVVEQGRSISSLSECREIAHNLRELINTNEIDQDFAKAQLKDQGCQRYRALLEN